MGHSVDGQQRDLTSTPTLLVGKGPPGRLTTECFYFRRVGRPAGPTGRPSAYVGVRRTKKMRKQSKLTKQIPAGPMRRPSADIGVQRAMAAFWADNTGGMTVSKSTLIKTN